MGKDLMIESINLVKYPVMDRWHLAKIFQRFQHAYKVLSGLADETSTKDSVENNRILSALCRQLYRTSKVIAFYTKEENCYTVWCDSEIPLNHTVTVRGKRYVLSLKKVPLKPSADNMIHVDKALHAVINTSKARWRDEKIILIKEDPIINVFLWNGKAMIVPYPVKKYMLRKSLYDFYKEGKLKEIEKMLERDPVAVRPVKGYVFSSKGGLLTRVVYLGTKEWSEYYAKIKEYYSNAGNEKREWFKRQPQAQPILEIKYNNKEEPEYWLSSAITLQVSPTNVKLLVERLKILNKGEIYNMLYPTASKVKEEIHELINRVSRVLFAEPLKKETLRPIEKFVHPKIKVKTRDGKEIELDGPRLMFDRGRIKYTAYDFRGNVALIVLYSGDTEEEDTVLDVAWKLKKRLEYMVTPESSQYRGRKNRRISGIYLKNEIYDSEESAVKAALEWKKKGWTPVILQFLEEEDHSIDSPYAKIRRKALKESIPVQTILMEKARKISSSILNNLAFGIIAKTGGRPWIVEGAGGFERPMYIGYDVSYRKGSSFMASVVVLDYKGQIIYVDTNTEIPTLEGDIVNPDYLATHLKELVEEVARKNYSPDAIFLFRDGDIDNIELDKIKDRLKELAEEYGLGQAGIITFPKRGRIYIVSPESKEDGILVDCGKQLVRGRMSRTYALQTLPPKGLRSVPAIKFRDEWHFKEDPDYIKKIARDIYNQTFLHWSGGMRIQLPASVHFAHKASLLLSYGIKNINLENKQMLIMA